VATPTISIIKRNYHTNKRQKSFKRKISRLQGQKALSHQRQ
jgi:hypothetical protein